MNKKTSMTFIYSILVGIILLLIGLVSKHLGMSIEFDSISAVAIFCTVVTYLLLTPQSYQKLKYLCNEIDWADETVKFYQSIPELYRKSFWWSFLFINLAFLFHTINFMWGAFDWQAVRFDVNAVSDVNNANFAVYALQNLLFDGKILPVINNLWSFAGLSLGGVLLAYYWGLPKKTLAYVVTTLFLAVTPYTLGIMYFAQFTLGNLWVPCFVLTALLLAEKASVSLNRSYLYNLISVALFVLSLGTSILSISFIGMVILGRIFLNVATSATSFRKASYRHLQGLANFVAGLFIYSFMIILLRTTANNGTSFPSLLSMIKNIPDMFMGMFMQFGVTLPFVDLGYKILGVLIVVTTLFTVIFKANSLKSSLVCLGLIPLILVFSCISYLVIDGVQASYMVYNMFYSLPLFYTLMFVCLVKFNGVYLKRFAYGMAFILIFMGFVRIAYGLKVWKFGFDAETKLAERIITRMEKMDEFNIEKQYKLLQIGSQSLRKKYYIKKDKEQNSPELLDIAYYKEGVASDAYNFFYQADFLADDVGLKTAAENPNIKNFVLNVARAWPHKDSIFIDGEYIVFVLDENALYQAQRELLK